MIIGAYGSRSLRLEHLRVTLSRSKTFQKLVGAFSEDQSLAKVFDDVSLDVAVEDPDFDAIYPRGIIRHEGPQMAVKHGLESWSGVGGMGIYVQYQQLSDDELSKWYRMAGPFDTDDQRRHMNNLFGLISDEMMGVGSDAGCLELGRLEEFSCGYADPKLENGKKIVELCWVVHREGVP